MFLCVPVFSVLLGISPEVELLGRIVTTFNLLRAFQSGCTIFHSHHQQMRVAIVPHPCQHLVLSVVWILAILISV